MAIKDLVSKQGNVDLTADVVEKGDVRTFNKFGKEGRVCNAKIKDNTGQITLTLWNEQIDNIQVGNKVHVINGYVSEWQGEKQLSTGKFGQLEVVEKGNAEASAEKSGEEDQKAIENEEDTSEDKVDDDENLGEGIVKDEEDVI